MVSILGRDREGRVTIFVARISNGALVLVHPIRQKNQFFLPCCYGYATTIRRAQGSSHHLGALYFDHCYPPEPGYGYVGSSRFRSSGGLYFYGKIRRTDWRPVAKAEGLQTRRSALSETSESGAEGPDSDEESEYARSSSSSSMALGEEDYSTDHESIALGEEDSSSDDVSMPDDNYLDQEGNLSCGDGGLYNSEDEYEADDEDDRGLALSGA